MPVNEDRPRSSALTDTSQTTLGQAVTRLSVDKGEMSGFSPLSEGLDAFAARAILSNVAEQSIDVQYYIWHSDDVGRLMSVALIKAAERGVRVRVLIDDLGLGAPDLNLVSIDAHPNIEIRLFNPVINRSWRAIESVFSFSRINRRMHNKSFTVDNQMTIVGGRNIGNEYFDAAPDVNFNDFDVLAMGPVAHEVSDSFDKYWNSEYAIPVAEIIHENGKPIEEVVKTALELEAELKNSPYLQAVRESEFVTHLKNRTLPLYWGDAHVLYDDPEKLRSYSDNDETHLLTKIGPIVGDIQREFMIISPYFVPGKDGVEDIGNLIKQGVSVKILTNSLVATDVGIVHAGYAKYRLPLLEEGAELHEAKPDPTRAKKSNKQKNSGMSGSSRSSLHSKVYVFDRKRVFVGSLNLDPRSAKINTELGIFFENDEFAGMLGHWWDTQIANLAYQVKFETRKVDEGWREREIKSLYWVEHFDGQNKVYTSEPQTGFWRRLGVGFLSIFPVESQL